MGLDYPEELAIQKNKEIINDILKKQVSLEIEQFSLEEDFENNHSHIFFILNFRYKRNKQFKLESSGSGIIDALFTGIINKFSDDYISLKNIHLYDFIVNVNFKESKRLLNTDAPVEVKIILQGTSKNKLYFKAKSNSLVKAAIGATCNSIEYLINAELAVIQLSKDLKAATKRQRDDLQKIYTFQLSELVNFISYSAVINNLNKK